MNKNKWYIYLAVVWISGTLLHFVYDWSGQNIIVQAIGAANESIWEHYKLLFYPILGMSVYRAVKTKCSVWVAAAAVACALTHGALVMFGIFYAYTGALGTPPILIVDIASFFLTSAISFYIMERCLKLRVSKAMGVLGVAVTAILLFCVVGFSYFPPSLPIFIEL